MALGYSVPLRLAPCGAIRVLQNSSRVSGAGLYNPEQCEGYMAALFGSEVSLYVSPEILCLLPRG